MVCDAWGPPGLLNILGTPVRHHLPGDSHLSLKLEGPGPLRHLARSLIQLPFDPQLRTSGHDNDALNLVPLRSLGLLGTTSYIGYPQSRREPAALVEAVHLRILPAALEQHVIAATCPRLRKRGLNHSSPILSSTKLRMCYDVLDECMPMPAS